MDLEKGLKNIIQFQNKRTGSTFLQNALNTHPDLVGLDEMFVNSIMPGGRKSGLIPYILTTNSQPQEYIEQVLWANSNSHVSFKLMYNQIEYHKGLLDFIKESKIPIIHLKRKNLLKQAISYFRQTNAMPINYMILYDSVVGYEKEAERWTEEFKDHDIIEFFYEDMIGETKDEFTYISEYVNMLICNFFDIPNVPMFSGTKKKRVESIWKFIPDKQRTIEKFKNTKYEWMLDESKSKER
jgi:hypothetical protein